MESYIVADNVIIIPIFSIPSLNSVIKCLLMGNFQHQAIYGEIFGSRILAAPSFYLTIKQ